MIGRQYLNPGLALPVGILTIILLMVMPIPALLLDVFFVLNIALSVSVLMAAMNAKKPLDFSSFPSVLLFATLLRLALNVASTRIVLLNGHEGGAAAGKVIEAFGAFLIGGNFAVGIFVFLILPLSFFATLFLTSFAFALALTFLGVGLVRLGGVFGREVFVHLPLDQLVKDLLEVVVCGVKVVFGHLDQPGFRAHTDEDVDEVALIQHLVFRPWEQW